jgi:hypothetical protein
MLKVLLPVDGSETASAHPRADQDVGHARGEQESPRRRRCEVHRAQTRWPDRRVHHRHFGGAMSHPGPGTVRFRFDLAASGAPS